jgi:hypothetical protein
MTLKDRICEATDTLNAVRIAFYTGSATYDDCKAAAIKVLEIRREIEIYKTGKARTKVTPVAIASLIR